MTPARRRKVAQKSLLHAKLFSPSGGLTEHVTKMERLCLHRGLVGTGSGSRGLESRKNAIDSALALA